MQIQPKNSDELLYLTPENGRRRYRSAPADEAELKCTPALPASNESAEFARYLWVIDDEDVPHALELCAWAQELKAKRLKHSNLTGGAAAYFGGEVWFVDPRTLIINFCSGRYGAITADDQSRIDATIEALVEDGYRVATTGSDIENGYLSSRILVSDPIYQGPADG